MATALLVYCPYSIASRGSAKAAGSFGWKARYPARAEIDRLVVLDDQYQNSGEFVSRSNGYIESWIEPNEGRRCYSEQDMVDADLLFPADCRAYFGPRGARPPFRVVPIP